MKQLLLDTPIGHISLNLRDKLKLLSTAILKAEAIGTLANDQLASLLIVKLCQPNKTFIDIGAHIGSVISGVHTHEPSVKIIALEAIPTKADNLQKKFPYATVHCCAVSDTEGEASFFINTIRSGYSSLSRPSHQQDSFKEITVPLKPIDTLINAIDIDAIKIDVEGAELAAIRGSRKTIEKNRPTIMFESGPEEDSDLGYSKSELWQELEQLGYMILIPNRVAHDDQGLSLEGFLESHIYPRRTTNYFAIPKERRREIRDKARVIVGIKTK